MANVVVMPTFRRPEFLALALEAIDRAEDAPDDVRIYLDHNGPVDEVEWVRDTYLPRATMFHAGSHEAAPSGCWNILNSLKAGYKTGAEIVFFVEEDVRVYPNYFTWSVEAQKRGCFATSGRFIKRYGENYYTNPGASFRRESLALVVPHICLEFFADRRGYMDRTFGPMDEASDLDDGLIRRVMRSVGGVVKYPDSPAVAHQGFHYYGKCEEWRTTGSIQDRVSQLQQMLKTIDPVNRYTQDFEPFLSRYS